jgi:putative spermidine/putrescine transport system permease protein
VTIFTAGGHTTLPIWIWTGLRTGGSGSEINVVAAVVVLLSVVPVYFAQRLTSGADARAGVGSQPS